MIRISCLLFEGFVLLDMAGPITAFETASQCGVPGYSIEVLGSTTGNVTSSSGATVGSIDFRRTQGCDILLIPGGLGVQNRENYAHLLPFIRSVAENGCKLASVCSGAFLLAEAGLLEGRTAATHWREAAELARRFPSINVDAESLFVRDGNIWTSAGISSGIDLALAMIQDDYGFETARRVAQILVVSVNRPGGQSQHSALLELVGGDNRFNEILIWARSHLNEPLDVEHLAERAALSVRQFTRAFTATIGIAPAKAIERLRLENARTSIEAGARSLEQVARDSGFGNIDRMRRAFVRSFGVTPQTMRRHLSPDDSAEAATDHIR
ncbi:GlxA family transcriptional regulator [Paraburkholderia sp. GAS32]|uniref:GlxA family transcriptional regulator n=1 Tax=Paraburkholderia sp. GAS32 TaxID=3035129 RepID=UPI003D1926B5